MFHRGPAVVLRPGDGVFGERRPVAEPRARTLPHQAVARRRTRAVADGLADARRLPPAARARRHLYLAGPLPGAAGGCALLAAAQRHPAVVLPARHLGPPVTPRQAGA